MRFQRIERYERFTWTKRKEACALARPARQAARLRKAMPLLAEQIEVGAPVDLDDEAASRQARLDRSEQRIRAHYATVWRESRRDYFDASEAQKAAIRAHWNEWRGPRTCLYFRYVVDLHTGVDEARIKAMRQRQAEIHRRIAGDAATQTTLAFVDAR